MAQESINLGSSPLGSGGDTAREAFTKVNTNFTELFESLSSQNIAIDEGGNFTFTDNEGNYKLLLADGLYLDNGSYVTKGSFDSGNGGANGISLFCTIGYEFNWQAGRLRIKQDNSDDYPLILDSNFEITQGRLTFGEGEGSISLSNTIDYNVLRLHSGTMQAPKFRGPQTDEAFNAQLIFTITDPQEGEGFLIGDENGGYGFYYRETPVEDNEFNLEEGEFFLTNVIDGKGMNLTTSYDSENGQFTVNAVNQGSEGFVQYSENAGWVTVISWEPQGQDDKYSTYLGNTNPVLVESHGDIVVTGNAAFVRAEQTDSKFYTGTNDDGYGFISYNINPVSEQIDDPSDDAMGVQFRYDRIRFYYYPQSGYEEENGEMFGDGSTVMSLYEDEISLNQNTYISGDLHVSGTLFTSGGGGDVDANKIRGRDVNDNSPYQGYALVWNATNNFYDPQLVGTWPVPSETGIDLFDQNSIHRYYINFYSAQEGSYTTHHGVIIDYTMDEDDVEAAWNDVVSPADWAEAPENKWLEVTTWNGWNDYRITYVGAYANTKIDVATVVSSTGDIGSVDAIQVQAGRSRNSTLQDGSISDAGEYFYGPAGMIYINSPDGGTLNIDNVNNTKMFFLTNTSDSEVAIFANANDEDPLALLTEDQTKMFVKSNGNWFEFGKTPEIVINWAHPGEIGTGTPNGAVFTNCIASAFYGDGANLTNVPTKISGSGVPSSSSDTGTVGDIRIDADFIYVCVGSNTWKRSALTTW